MASLRGQVTPNKTRALASGVATVVGLALRFRRWIERLPQHRRRGGRLRLRQCRDRAPGGLESLVDVLCAMLAGHGGRHVASAVEDCVCELSDGAGGAAKQCAPYQKRAGCFRGALLHFDAPNSPGANVSVRRGRERKGDAAMVGRRPHGLAVALHEAAEPARADSLAWGREQRFD